MTDNRFRLGFLSHVEGGADLRQTYANVQELFVVADELGFDTGWVAQHHTWPSEHGGLPSPWVFLAHAAAKTTSIHLGTAITIAPLEDPIRLAEDVGVLDALSGGRVELGVGSGYSPVEYGLFDKDFDRKRELTTEVLARTLAALRGQPLDDNGTTLIPVSPDLAANRIWHGIFSNEGARHVAREGTNLLLNRATYGYAEPTDVVQRPWADTYLDEWQLDRKPRIGISRLILAAKDRDTALSYLADGVLDGVRRTSGSAQGSIGTPTLEDALFHFNAFYGHPDEIIPRLAEEKVLPVATDLLAQFNPGTPTLDVAIRALEYLAREIAPALGWSPAEQVAAVDSNTDALSRG
ncbi:MAG: monooxygenase [Glaciihabitans sp.]|nr:monooxygenase [Glaciihabitans sp.]